jgi:hypothetical protein
VLVFFIQAWNHSLRAKAWTPSLRAKACTELAHSGRRPRLKGEGKSHWTATAVSASLTQGEKRVGDRVVHPVADVGARLGGWQ